MLKMSFVKKNRNFKFIFNFRSYLCHPISLKYKLTPHLLHHFIVKAIFLQNGQADRVLRLGIALFFSNGACSIRTFAEFNNKYL